MAGLIFLEAFLLTLLRRAGGVCSAGTAHLPPQGSKARAGEESLPESHARLHPAQDVAVPCLGGFSAGPNWLSRDLRFWKTRGAHGVLENKR